MQEIFGTFYEGLRLQEGRKVLLQPIFFLFRRLLLALTVVTFNDVLIVQIYLIAGQTIASIMIIGLIKPFDDEKQNFIEMANEMFILFTLYGMICFSPFITD
jgi:hypothetical protein